MSRRLAAAAVALTLLAAARLRAEQNYELGPGDVLHVLVLGQESMSGEFTIDEGGLMRFPFLGQVKAAGLQPPELERKLVTLLSDGYLKKPQVSVSVKQFRSRRVFVTGEVARPGPYGLRADHSLMTLLKDVGDLTPQVGHEVVVIRAPLPPPPQVEMVPPSPSPDEPEPPGNGSTNGSASASPAPTPLPSPPPMQGLPGEVPGSLVFRVNLRELRAGYPGKDLRLEVGDTVYFPKQAQYYVTGHVARPGAFRYEEGMTVFQALAAAGSTTDRGSSKIRIIRIVEGRRQELKAKMTDLVLPEDEIRVPERFF
jgi:polysaccharide export outer membrane protein